MSHHAEPHRQAMRAKARRLAGGDPHEKVDASGYSPPSEMEAEKKTGKQPTSRNHFKRGGKISGDKALHHAGKKPRTGNKRPHEADGGSFVPTQRFGFSPVAPGALSKETGFKSGGSAKSQSEAVKEKEDKTNGRRRRASGGDVLEALSPAYALAKNPNALKAISPVANLKRGGGVDTGTRPTGGRKAHKHGGKADAHWIESAVKHKGALHRELHVPEGEKIPAKKMEKAEHSKDKLVAKRARLAETLSEMRPGRKSGGRTKGKTNINIVIDAGKAAQAPAPPPMPPPQAMPIRPPVPMPPPGAAPPMGMGAPPPGLPPQVPPQMQRKRGGRTTMTAGARSGEGRLEKMRDL